MLVLVPSPGAWCCRGYSSAAPLRLGRDVGRRGHNYAAPLRSDEHRADNKGFFQDRIESFEQDGQCRTIECQGWPNFQNVIVGAFGTNQNTFSAQSLFHLHCRCRRWCSRLAVGYQFDADKQAHSSYITDNWVLLLKFAETGQQLATDPCRVCHQSFFIDDP